MTYVVKAPSSADAGKQILLKITDVDYFEVNAGTLLFYKRSRKNPVKAFGPGGWFYVLENDKKL